MTSTTTPQPRGVAEFLRGIDLSGLPLIENNHSQLFDDLDSFPLSTTLSSSSFLSSSANLDFSWCEQLPRLQWLKLGRTGLTEIPAEIPRLPRLEHLTLNKNTVKALRPGLANLKHLRVLNCRNNAIDNTGIPQKLFNNQELQVFDASHNVLTSVPSNLIQATSLLVLNLSYNQLTSIPSDLFTQCTELMFLDLSHNQLNEMPAQLRRLTKLQSLRLSYNPLRHAQLRALSALRDLRVLDLAATERRAETALPSDLAEKCNKLQELNLAENGLNRVPDVVFSLHSLIKLDMNGNELNDLSAMVDSWPFLQYLNLSFNQLTNLPASLCRLTHLRKFYVNRNCLTFSGLPAGIGKLQDLTVFNASNNELENIPEGLCRCGRLKRLMLNDNRLITLPDAIHYLIETLDVFEMAGNPNLILPPKPPELQRGSGLAYYNIDFSLENMLRQAAGGRAIQRQDSSSSTKDAAARLRRLRSRRPHLTSGNASGGTSRYSNDDSDAASSRVLEGMRRVARDKEGRRERDMEAEQQAHQQEQARRWKQMLVRPMLDYSRIFDEDVGNELGVEIWEIDEFYPKHLDQEVLHGTFYDGDCYIVLHTYSETASLNRTHQLQWAIYYWIGKRASLDKQACAAMHAVNLRNLLKAESRTRREDQGEESEEFLRLMPPPGIINIIEGTHGETGFLRVEETELPTKLYRLYPDGQRMGVISMPVSVKSLDPKYAYALDSNLGSFVWLGSDSRTVAQTKARLLAEKLAIERRKRSAPPSSSPSSSSNSNNNTTTDDANNTSNNKTQSIIQVEVQNRESSLFWLALTGSDSEDSGSAQSTLLINNDTNDDFNSLHVQVQDHIPLNWVAPLPVVFDVHLGKGYLELPQVPLGPSTCLRKELLQSKHVYIIRSGGEVFVWLGRQSPKFLRFAGMKLADECKNIMCLDWKNDSDIVSPGTPTVCTEGVEPQIFKTQFRGWDDTIAVDFTRTAESVRKRGADVNAILENDKMKVDLKHIFIPRETPPTYDEALQSIQDYNEDLVGYFDLCENDEPDQDEEENVVDDEEGGRGGEARDDGEENKKEISSSAPPPPPGAIKQLLKQFILHGSKWSAVENRWKGHFFSQDCYLILAEYWDCSDANDASSQKSEGDGENSEEENNESNKIQTVIYFWQGRDASDVCLHQFNLSLRKQLVDQLTAASGGKGSVTTRTFRQQQEDSVFLAHYERGITIHYGRYEERYSPVVHEKSIEMFVLRSQGGCPLNSRCIQVAPSIQQLNSHFNCIVRVPAALIMALKQKHAKTTSSSASNEIVGDRVYVWIGSAAHPDEEAIVIRLARENYDGLNNANIIIVREKQEDALFWLVLGGKQAYDATADYLWQSRLFRLSNEQGYFTASEKCVDFCQDDLADDDVMMLDTGEQIYLWFGSRSSDVERKLAPQAAKVYREHLARIQPNKPRQLRIAEKGRETHLFRRCFHGWSKFRQHLQ